jgi:hypothetical protein
MKNMAVKLLILVEIELTNLVKMKFQKFSNN